MNPKTILEICIAVIIVTTTIKSFLNIIGITKTEVIGGPRAEAIFIATTAGSAVGWGIFLIVLVTNGETIYNAVSCFFGS